MASASEPLSYCDAITCELGDGPFESADVPVFDGSTGDEPFESVDVPVFDGLTGDESAGERSFDAPDGTADSEVDPHLPLLRSADPLDRIFGALLMWQGTDIGSDDFRSHLFLISTELEALECVPDNFFSETKLMDILMSVLPSISVECADLALSVLYRVVQLSSAHLEEFVERDDAYVFLSLFFMSQDLMPRLHCQLVYIVQEMLPISSNGDLSFDLLKLVLSRPFSGYNALDVSKMAHAVFETIDVFLCNAVEPKIFEDTFELVSDYSAAHEEHALFAFLREVYAPSFRPLLACFQNLEYAAYAGFLAHFGLRLLEAQVELDLFFPLTDLVSLSVDPVTGPDDQAAIYEFLTGFASHSGLSGLLAFDGESAFLHFCEDGRPSADVLQGCLKIWWVAFVSSAFEERVRFVNDTSLSSVIFQSPDSSFVSADQLRDAFVDRDDSSYLDQLDFDAWNMIEDFFIELGDHEDETLAQASRAIWELLHL
jgi:hypothetical protein